jgi:hypothetical protein
MKAHKFPSEHLRHPGKTRRFYVGAVETALDHLGGELAGTLYAQGVD